MAWPLNETFPGSAGADLSAISGWGVHPLYSGSVIKLSGAGSSYSGVSGGAAIYTYSGTPGYVNVDVEFDLIVKSTGEYGGVIIHTDTAAGAHIFGGIVPNGWSVYKYPAGAELAHTGSAAPALGTYHGRIKYRQLGVSRVEIRFTLGGIDLLWFEDTSSPITSIGKVGVQFYNVGGASTPTTGIHIANLAARNRAPNLVICGIDSLTSGVGASDQAHSWPAQLDALLGDDQWDVVNLGIPSRTLDDAASDVTTTVDARYDATRTSNWYALWGGTNDLYFGASAATAYSRYKSFAQGRQGVGFSLLGIPMLPRSGFSTPPDIETNRQTLNTDIYANIGGFWNKLADVAADSRIGDAGDQNDTTYYADLIHLTDAGYAIVAGLVYDQLTAGTDYSVSFSDSLALSDARSLSLARVISEAVALADARAAGLTRAIAESLTVSDARALSLVRSLAESLSVADSRALRLTRALAESVGISDARALSLVRALTQSIALSESLSTAMNGSGQALLVSFTDALTLADSRILSAQHALGESLSLSDARVVTLARVLVEAIALSEARSGAVAYVRGLSESLGASDSAARTGAFLRAFADALGVSDSAAASIVGLVPIAMHGERLSEGLPGTRLERALTGSRLEE